ncbi:amino acid permease [Haloterrigena salifodinae]|uniref:Amino acid permease n=1 Tax=Haloterrigena salifodinae TaxID=2675099 RepID=A0A8T8DZC4_9EURY|nr:amino acid permease [Haloterrigena salifodinae]QRV14944.1 amino acid permease [Haloterrigena salifodinae]
MSEADGLPGHEHDEELARDMSLFDITMIGVGAMIGAGIFVLTGLAAGQAGPGLVMAFAFNGFITIFTGMVYAELGSAIPEAGGGYLWVREALGRSQAFLAGWMSWFAHAVAGSLYTLGFGAFVHLLLTDYFGIPLFEPIDLAVLAIGPEKVFAAFAGVLFAYINYRGAKETGLAGNVVTLVKITVILVLIAFGLGYIVGHPAEASGRFRPFLPRDFSGIFIAMGLTFIAFEGYEIIVQSGEEVVEPKKSVPKAVFYSMSIVVTIYMLVAIVLIGAVSVTPGLFELAQEGAASGGHGATNLPPVPANIEDAAVWEILGHLGEFGLARAAGQIMPYGTVVILVAGIFSTLSALNATTYSSTRVSFAMGRDHVLPDAFGSVHPEKQTPHVATALSGALIIFMAVVLPIEAVAAATDVMFLLLFLQVNYAAIVIRREWGDQIDYGYVMPYFPYVPIIGILTKLALAVYLFNYSPLAWYGALAWILVGVGIFFLYSRGRVRETEAREETRFITEERAPVDREYQVLVPLADPSNAEQLIRAGSAIARREDGEILLTSVATVPDQTPLSEGRRYADEQGALLDNVLEYIPDDVPAHRTVTIGHDVGTSINNVAYQRDSDLVVMGWRGRRKRFSDYALGSNIDTVVENGPCDVAVMKTNGAPASSRVLVPTAGGPHADLAERFAIAYADIGADVTLFHAVTDGDADAAESHLRERKEALADAGIDVDIDTAIAERDEIDDAILEYARDGGFDTIVIGAAGEGILQRVLFGEIPETIGEEFDGTVVMTRKHRPVQSSLKRVVRKWVGKGARATDIGPSPSRSDD